MSNAARVRMRCEQVAQAARDVLSDFTTDQLRDFIDLFAAGEERATVEHDLPAKVALMCAVSHLIGEVTRRVEDEERSNGA